MYKRINLRTFIEILSPQGIMWLIQATKESEIKKHRKNSNKLLNESFKGNRKSKDTTRLYQKMLTVEKF